MPLSKARDKERKRLERQRGKLGWTQVGHKALPREAVQPSENNVQPNRYLEAHLKVYPDAYKKGYDPTLDPYINPLVRPIEHLPNCPDGRYREHFSPAPKPVKKGRR